MITAAMLSLMRDSCMNALILVENVEEAEFRRSRLTRAEVRKHYRTVAETARNLEPEVRTALAKIDWPGWARVLAALDAGDGDEQSAVVWEAIRLLGPATLTWLRVYPKIHPELFEMKPFAG
ncbi:hypothetical protein [Derxia gummosa]|uniref:Uncharacterized protein n=1 Tax=Derxia gummosa DSM 723 TaxID=1121388 RepID=A0A8B6X616_9BURK|nr:hypothetical protein [Derxia gummosa]